MSLDDFEKLGYNTKSMQLYMKYVEQKMVYSSNGYMEVFIHSIIHNFKEFNKSYFTMSHFPVENMSILYFEGKILDWECRPAISYLKTPLKYQYVLGISFICDEKIPENSEFELFLHYKLMDWSLNNKKRILEALKEIYGDTRIAAYIATNSFNPILEYEVTISYPGFAIRKSVQAISDRIDLFGNPISVLEYKEIQHDYNSISVKLSKLLPNMAYVFINYLD